MDIRKFVGTVAILLGVFGAYALIAGKSKDEGLRAGVLAGSIVSLAAGVVLRHEQ